MGLSYNGHFFLDQIGHMYVSLTRSYVIKLLVRFAGLERCGRPEYSPATLVVLQMVFHS